MFRESIFRTINTRLISKEGSMIKYKISSFFFHETYSFDLWEILKNEIIFPDQLIDQLPANSGINMLIMPNDDKQQCNL